MKELISKELISSKIFIIRGKRVMLDTDLALLYGVQTKRLNEQVKRNNKRFPEDFVFQLTTKEKKEVVAICDHLKFLKFSPHLPLAFTEQGVAMLSGVLNSARAIKVNIEIMRAFVKLRQIISAHKELTHKLEELERRVTKHDVEIKDVLEAIRQLMKPPERPERRIGFHAD